MLIENEGNAQENNEIDPSASGEAEAAQGENKDAKSGEGDAKGANAPTLETLQAQLAESQRRLEEVSLRQLDPDYQDYLASKRSGKSQEPPAPKTDPLAELDDEKLGTMTNRQLIETAVNIFATKLREEFLPEIETRLESLGDSVADQSAKRDVAETASRYKDFWNYKREMVALSTKPQYQHLNAEDIYLLAKSRTSGGRAPAPAPGVVSKPTVGQVRSAKAGSEKPNVAPQGGRAESKEMTREEAGSDAWEKVFGK